MYKQKSLSEVVDSLRADLQPSTSDAAPQQSTTATAETPSTATPQPSQTAVPGVADWASLANQSKASDAYAPLQEEEMDTSFPGEIKTPDPSAPTTIGNSNSAAVSEVVSSETARMEEQKKIDDNTIRLSPHYTIYKQDDGTYKDEDGNPVNDKGYHLLDDKGNFNPYEVFPDDTQYIANMKNIYSNFRVDGNPNNGIASLSNEASTSTSTDQGETVKRKVYDPGFDIDAEMKKVYPEAERHGHLRLMEKLQGGTPEELKARNDKIQRDIARRRDRHQFVESLRLLSDIIGASSGGNVWKRNRVDYSKYDRDRIMQDNAYRNAIQQLYAADAQDQAATAAMRSKFIDNAYQEVTSHRNSKTANTQKIEGSLSDPKRYGSGGGNGYGRGSQNVITGDFKTSNGNVKLGWQNNDQRANRLTNASVHLEKIYHNNAYGNPTKPLDQLRADAKTASTPEQRAKINKEINNRQAIYACLGVILSDQTFTSLVFGGAFHPTTSKKDVHGNTVTSVDTSRYLSKYRQNGNWNMQAILNDKFLMGKFFNYMTNAESTVTYAGGQKKFSPGNIDNIYRCISSATEFCPDLLDILDPEKLRYTY